MNPEGMKQSIESRIAAVTSPEEFYEVLKGGGRFDASLGGNYFKTYDGEGMAKTAKHLVESNMLDNESDMEWAHNNVPAHVLDKILELRKKE